MSGPLETFGPGLRNAVPEKRIYQRWKILVPCLLRWKDQEIAGQIADLSFGGALITEVDDPPPTGSSVRVQLQINNPNTPDTDLSAMVVRSDSAKRSLAVSFDESPEDLGPTLIPERWGPGPITADDLPFGLDFIKGLFDSLYDGVYVVDRERRILFWNRGAEQITGYGADRVLGSFCYANLLRHKDCEGRLLCHSRCPLVKSISEDIPISERLFLKHQDGRRVAVDTSVMPIHDQFGVVTGAVEIFRDASSAVAMQAAYGKMRELAERDPLTGLANRRSCFRILEHQLELLKQTGIPLSLILTDVDHFKAINDTYGHPVGDKTLMSVASQLESGCRQKDIVGRIGGEEFLIVLPETHLDQAIEVAEGLRLSISGAPPVELKDRGLTASFGVTEATRSDNSESIFERVDNALYRAKEGGKDQVEPA